MAAVREFYYPSSDGLHQVHAMEWRPDSGEPKGVVQLVHGISEYVGRYDAFARFLADRGYAVAGNDHLGHGLTAASRKELGFLAELDGWNHAVNDVHALRDTMGKAYPCLPYFILGHSMGSFLTRTYLIDHPGDVTGAILSGTGQEPPVLVGVGWWLSNLLSRAYGPKRVSKLITALSLGGYNANFKPNRTQADWISRDAAVVDAYVADPLCRFVPTVGMFRDMMEGLTYICKRKNLRKMDPDTPVYFFSGDADPVGGRGAGVRKVEGFFRDAGVKDLELKLYPGGRHEMLNEINRQEVFADVLDWLEKHLPGA